MFEVIFTDIREAVDAVWYDSSRTTLVLMAVVIIGQGVLMKRWGEAFGKASQGLVFLGLLAFLVHQLLPQETYNLDGISSSFIGAWASVMAMRIQDILGYLVILFIGVLIVHALTSLVKKVL
ncbi:hypothetical protein [Parvularcula sp. LCG005]|uniref:hypothetical protein n=1 Tax=Parvularcula sp. LCG005 TaxID=3078805 RepID=UPI002942B4C2|nr:hypothetical protein [Parvularcula sp. LCG005]WOI52325.1 hypothetical protein RUI03_09190 [Parvularcula sp. LCG005]